MGIYDREYMRAERGGPQFRPPRRSMSLGTVFLGALLVAGIAFTIAKVQRLSKEKEAAAVRAEQLERNLRRAEAAPAPPPATPRLSPPVLSVPRAARAIPAARDDEELPARKVMKCQDANGVAYGDNVRCDRRATELVVERGPAVAPPPPRPQIVKTETVRVVEHPPVVINNSPAPVDHKRIQCEGLAAEIRGLDAAARQPHGGQSQDWIRQRKAQAQSRQFDLRC